MKSLIAVFALLVFGSHALAESKSVRNEIFDFYLGRRVSKTVIHELKSGRDVEILSALVSEYREGDAIFHTESETSSPQVPGKVQRAISTWTKVADHYECTLVDDQGNRSVDKMYLLGARKCRVEMLINGHLVTRSEEELKDEALVSIGQFFGANGEVIATSSSTIKDPNKRPEGTPEKSSPSKPSQPPVVPHP